MKMINSSFYLSVEALEIIYFFSSSLRSSSISLPSSLASQLTIIEGSSTAGCSSSGSETSSPLGILSGPFFTSVFLLKQCCSRV